MRNASLTRKERIFDENAGDAPAGVQILGEYPRRAAFESMSVETFIDTNILLYAYDSTAAGKQDIARSVLEGLWLLVVLADELLNLLGQQAADGSGTLSGEHTRLLKWYCGSDEG